MNGEESIKELSPDGSMSGQMISVIHQALDSYPVMVWNGKPEAVPHKLGEAITSISFEVRTVKNQVGFVEELVSGIKQRKEFLKSVSQTFKTFSEYIGLNKKWKTIMFLIQTSAALYGFYKLVIEIFFPELSQAIKK